MWNFSFRVLEIYVKLSSETTALAPKDNPANKIASLGSLTKLRISTKLRVLATIENMLNI